MWWCLSSFYRSQSSFLLIFFWLESFMEFMVSTSLDNSGPVAFPPHSLTRLCYFFSPCLQYVFLFFFPFDRILYSFSLLLFLVVLIFFVLPPLVFSASLLVLFPTLPLILFLFIVYFYCSFFWPYPFVQLFWILFQDMLPLSYSYSWPCHQEHLTPEWFIQHLSWTCVFYFFFIHINWEESFQGHI